MIATAEDIEGATFKTASSCGPNGPCVEVAVLKNGWVGIRDSKAGPSGPVLKFPPDQLRAFLRGAEAGEFPVPVLDEASA